MLSLPEVLVPDELWESFEPLLPPPKPKKKEGRPRVPDRACLAGIVYLLKTGCQWKWLPVGALGCGSPSTVWRRLQEWTQAGVWPRLHQKMLAWCDALGEVDPRRIVIDASAFRALFGGRTQGPAALIVRKMAASATSSPTATACRSRSGSPRATGATTNRP